MEKTQSIQRPLSLSGILEISPAHQRSRVGSNTGLGEQEFSGDFCLSLSSTNTVGKRDEGQRRRQLCRVITLALDLVKSDADSYDVNGGSVGEDSLGSHVGLPRSRRFRHCISRLGNTTMRDHNSYDTEEEDVTRD